MYKRQPFLYGLYWKRTTPAAVWASFATGIGITVSNMFLHYIASPINCLLYTSHLAGALLEADVREKQRKQAAAQTQIETLQKQILKERQEAVSYTHLDVYKRQQERSACIHL